jgi:hypothetical protein
MKVNLFGNSYSLLSLGIFGFLVILAAYYLGGRTGKGKSLSANSDALNKELNNQALTYEMSQYIALADKLESSMSGFSDDEQGIYAVFSKLRNKSDLLQLIKSFGSRRPSFSLGTGPLNTWLNMRLEDSEIAQINDILSRNNIQYEF